MGPDFWTPGPGVGELYLGVNRNSFGNSGSAATATI